MKKIMIIWVVAAVMVVAALGTTQIFNEKEKPASKPAVPLAKTTATTKAAPDFTLKDLSGKDVKLSDLKGKKVYVNFWATWCGYCVEEMPDLMKIKSENSDKNLVVLAINVGENEKDVSAFLKEKGFDFTVLLDADGKVSSNLYGVSGYPTSVFINSDGTISNVVEGMMKYEDMNAEVNKLK